MSFGFALPMLILYILGIITGVGKVFLFISDTWLITLVILFIAMLFLLIYLTCKNKNKAGVILIVFFLLGFLLASDRINYLSPLEEIAGVSVEVEGMVSRSTTYPNRTVYWLDNPIVLHGDRKFTGKKGEKVQLTIYNPTIDYSYGTIVKTRGVLKLPQPNRNPGGFNYREYLERRAIYTVINVEENQTTKVGIKPGNILLKNGIEIRDRIADLSYVLNQNEGGLFRAIILGDKSGINHEDRQVYQGLGVMHIFAVSGLHVGFVMFLLLSLTSIFPMPKNTANVFILLCLLIYCAATGFSSPVMRASIMLGIYLWGRENWSNVQTANSLFLAALFLLLLNPLMIFDAGFQLTFAATAFIIFLTPILKTNKYLGNSLIAVPIAAWLGTLPLTTYYFNTFTPLGIILALPAGLMAGGAVIIGFISLILDFLSSAISQFLMISVGGIIFYSNHLLQLFSKLPLIGEGINIATPKLPTIFLYYFGFVMAFIAYYHRYNPHLRYFIIKKYKPIIALILGCLVILLSFQVFAPSYLEVVFLDVGQGDCIFIKTPNGRVVLIDGGGVSGTNNYGDLVVIPFLKHLGIRKVDVVINTHPHADHLAGLYPVLEKYPVGLTLIPAGFEDEYGPFVNLIESRGLDYSYGKRAQSITLDSNIRLNILHPTSDYPASLGANNNSIVVELEYNDVSLLFTGDIEMDAINHMLPITTQSNVLKFPHHGGSGSFNTGYLAKINPEVVAIQVGENNSFGHPGRNVLEYFEAKGISVYRNDLHGAITIYSRGQRIDKVDTVIKFNGINK